jgi:hypothetical protein
LRFRLYTYACLFPSVLFYRFVVDSVQFCVSFYLSDIRCDSLAVRSAHRQHNQMSTLWSPRLNFGPTYPIADCHKPDHSINIHSPQHRVRRSNVVALPLLNGEWKNEPVFQQGKSMSFRDSAATVFGMTELHTQPLRSERSVPSLYCGSLIECSCGQQWNPCEYTSESRWNSNSNTLWPAQQQYDHPVAGVIAQQYSPVTFVSLRFYSRKGSRSKMLLFLFFFTLLICVIWGMSTDWNVFTEVIFPTAISWAKSPFYWWLRTNMP